MNQQRQEVQVRHYVQVDPPTPEFRILEKGSELSFIPLDAVWPDGDGNTSGRTVWGGDPKSYTQFRRGDILLPKVSPTFSHGRAMIADTDTDLGLASSEVYALRPRPQVDPRFISYALRSTHFLNEGTAAQTGMGGLRRVSTGWVKSYKFPLFSSAEQRRIADYLDWETGQIDETIARIDRVVDLIEERRARLHRDAFSENHPTTSLVTIAEITLGKMLDQKNTVGDPTEYLRAANVRKDGTIDLTDTKQMLMTEDERKRYELQAGDILMVEGGDAGRVALLPDDLPGLAIQKTLMRIRINDTVANPAYCYLWIDHLHKSGVLALDYSVSTIAHFTAEKAQRIRIPLPPLEVQKQTAKNLQAHNLEVEEMVNQASRLKSLLEERRSALITAAVTGRIEV